MKNDITVTVKGVAYDKDGNEKTIDKTLHANRGVVIQCGEDTDGGIAQQLLFFGEHNIKEVAGILSGMREAFGSSGMLRATVESLSIPSEGHGWDEEEAGE